MHDLDREILFLFEGGFASLACWETATATALSSEKRLAVRNRSCSSSGKGGKIEKELLCH